MVDAGRQVKDVEKRMMVEQTRVEKAISDCKKAGGLNCANPGSWTQWRMLKAQHRTLESSAPTLQDNYQQALSKLTMCRRDNGGRP